MGFILDLLLLLVFQYTQEKYKLQKTLNNLQEYLSMQSIASLMEEIMRNKSIEYKLPQQRME